MLRYCRKVLFFSLFFLPFEVSSQSNNILKPNEIYSPVGTPVKDKTVDEQSLAYSYYANRNFDKAAAIFEKLYEKSRKYNDYRFLLFSYIGLNDYDKAEKLIKQQSKIDNDYTDKYKVDAGYIQIMRGNAKKGSDLYEDAIKNMNNTENGVRSLANAFIGLKENEYAIKTYIKGRDLLKKPNLFSNELASIYYSQQNYKLMVEEYLNFVEAQPNQLQYVYGRFQDYMSRDPDGLVAEALKNTLLSKAQKEKEETFFQEMALWYFIQIKEFELAYSQAVSIAKKNNNNASTVFNLAEICENHNVYNVAEKCYSFVLNNYKNQPIELSAKIGLLNTKYKQFKAQKHFNAEDITKIDNLFNDIFKEIGTENLPEVLSYAEFYGFYKHEFAKAITLVENLLNGGRLKNSEIAQIKLCLGDLYLLSDNPWDATLLFSQVDKLMKDEPMGHEARFRNAKLFYYIGEFNWATEKLDILKSSTSKLIANDAMQLSLFIKDNKDSDTASLALSYFAKADLAFFKKDKQVALLLLDSAANVNVWGDIEDDVLYKKAEIYLSMDDYKKTDSLLTIIGEKYYDEIIADEALYLQAFINDKYLNNQEKAKNLYEKLFISYPNSIFAISSRNRFRELRGDIQNNFGNEYFLDIPLINL